MFMLIPLIALAAGGTAWVAKDVFFEDSQAVQSGVLPQGANGQFSPLALLGVPPAVQWLFWGVLAFLAYQFAKKKLKL